MYVVLEMEESVDVDLGRLAALKPEASNFINDKLDTV